MGTFKKTLKIQSIRIILGFCLVSFLPLSGHSRPITIQDGAWYDEELPIPVLHLEGSPTKTAHAHGLVLRAKPRGKEVLNFFSNRVEHGLKETPLFKSYPFLLKIVGWVQYYLYQRELVTNIPAIYRNVYHEFAKAAELEEKPVLKAVTVPDTLLHMVSVFYGKEPAPRIKPNFGCTSIIWDQDKKSTLHARNLDYDGVGLWDENQLILHVIPDNGLAHVAFTALGVHTSGITAFNEAGLTLALHQLTMKDTQTNGVPVTIIGDEIIRRARTIDEAIQIIKSYPRAGGWAFILSQGKDRAVVETSAHAVAVRRSKPESGNRFFYQTNHVSSPTLETNQIFYSAGSWIDSFERSGSLAKLKDKYKNKKATPTDLVKLLGHHKRIAGGTIAKLNNVQSVIMDGINRKAWVGVVGPSKAPNEFEYVEYSWKNLRSSDGPKVSRKRIKVESDLGETEEKLRMYLREAAHDGTYTAKQKSEWLNHYVQAVEVHKHNTKKLIAGSWPGLYLHVWHELKHRENPTKNTAQELLAILELALKDPELEKTEDAEKHWKSLGKLFRGRLLDLVERRGEAIFEYESARQLAPYNRVKVAAKQGLKAKYNWDNAKDLSIDWAGIDLLSL